MLNGTAQWASMLTNLQYLLSGSDVLLYSWRLNAGESAAARPRAVGKLEHGHKPLLGHYLSATAMAWAGTNHSVLQRRMRHVVAEMGAPYLTLARALRVQRPLRVLGLALAA